MTSVLAQKNLRTGFGKKLCDVGWFVVLKLVYGRDSALNPFRTCREHFELEREPLLVLSAPKGGLLLSQFTEALLKKNFQVVLHLFQERST